MASKIIKFRAPAGHKEDLSRAAQNAGMTVSELLRRAAKAAIAGRIASRPVLADLVHIRAMANHLDALCAVSSGEHAEIAVEIKNAAVSLRAIAARHLTVGK